MKETEFLGYLILAVTTLGGFFSVVHKITQPVNDLRIVIQELKDCIASLRNDSEAHTKRLEKLDAEVDNLSHRVGTIETTIEIYKNTKK